jgi:acyl carrier protein
MDTRTRIIDYIQSNLAGGAHGGEIGPQTPLLDEGILDSMGLMQLRMFIEDTLGVRVPDEEVMPDNFQDVASIEAMVERLRGSSLR